MFWHPVLSFVDLWPNLSRKVPLRVLLRYYFSDSTFHAEQNDMRQGYVRTTNNKVITLTLIWPLIPYKSDRVSDHTVRRGLLQWFFDIIDLYLAPGKVSQFVHILNDWPVFRHIGTGLLGITEKTLQKFKIKAKLLDIFQFLQYKSSANSAIGFKFHVNIY